MTTKEFFEECLKVQPTPGREMFMEVYVSRAELRTRHDDLIKELNKALEDLDVKDERHDKLHFVLSKLCEQGGHQIPEDTSVDHRRCFCGETVFEKHEPPVPRHAIAEVRTGKLIITIEDQTYA